MASLDTATRVELRLLCRSNGLRGYSRMTCAQMRDALRALPPKRFTDAVPVKKVTP